MSEQQKRIADEVHTLERLTEEIIELRVEIGLLAEAMKVRRTLCVNGPASRADLTVIQNARETIQRLIVKEGMTAQVERECAPTA